MLNASKRTSLIPPPRVANQSARPLPLCAVGKSSTITPACSLERLHWIYPPLSHAATALHQVRDAVVRRNSQAKFSAIRAGYKVGGGQDHRLAPASTRQGRAGTDGTVVTCRYIRRATRCQLTDQQTFRTVERFRIESRTLELGCEPDTHSAVGDISLQLSALSAKGAKPRRSAPTPWTPSAALPHPLEQHPTEK